jgi:zinc/manganese transport system substrate-binding protein/manganese/iron transport system substrate-binding protein
LVTTAVVVCALGLAACRPAGVGGSGAGIRDAQSPSATVRSALRVVATTTVFADIVRAVGGSRVEVSSIIPPGVGPEDYEPRPDDAVRLADARLIVSNGVGLDDFLGRLIAAGSGESTPQLVLGSGILSILDDGRPNPHFWLDPTLVRDHYVPAIAAKLAELDPDGRPDYEANATAYAADLDALDRELTDRLSVIPPSQRKLVTFHDAFPYFARHFGFEVVGVVLENVGQEPTAAELASLVERVKAAGVKAVFSEAQFNPALSRTLAQEAGITRVVTTLYNDALGPAPADTYLGLMRWNVGQIVEALRP